MKSYTTAELIEIARKHQHALTSVNKWNVYSETHDVPHAQTFIGHFGTWNNLKQQLNLNTNSQGRPQTFVETELVSILKEHGDHYTTIRNWNAFAEEHGLPGHHVFAKRIGLERLSQMTKYEGVSDAKDYKPMILKYFPNEPPTYNEWAELASKEKVPSATTLVRHYGKWNVMKHEVYFKKNQ